MSKIRVLQVGLGPLGLKVAKFISERKGIDIVAAVDKNPSLIGQSLFELDPSLSSQVIIKKNIIEAIAQTQVDVAVLTTVSDMERITPQVIEILEQQIPIVSTCEELSYPWDCAPEHSASIDQVARDNQVAVVGTGVNPGFLMDALPIFLTSACQHVEKIKVRRYQNASFRRLPFQKKIGAGLSLKEFGNKKEEGVLRHVGLTESMQMIAKRMGWHLTKTEDIISPVIAKDPVSSNDLKVKKGDCAGVQQIGRAYINNTVKIELDFKAAIGEQESFDEITIVGSPNIQSRIEGGVNGDIATSAITINTIPRILEARPGLKTMMDIAPVSFF